MDEPGSAGGGGPPPPPRRLAWSTAIFAAATGLSRVLGLVREVVVRNYFGVSGAINAFDIAFLIPNTVRALVADAALSSAFVPVFSELLEKGERARAWRVASTLLWLILLGLGGMTVLFILVAPWIMAPFPYEQDLLVGLSRLLFPIVLLLGLFGVVVGVLNSYEHFTVPALTPVFWNLVIILGLVIGVPRVEGNDELYVYAGSIVVATLVQLLLPLPWLRGLDGRAEQRRPRRGKPIPGRATGSNCSTDAIWPTGRTSLRSTISARTSTTPSASRTASPAATSRWSKARS